MAQDRGGEVQVTFAAGVKDDIAELAAERAGPSAGPEVEAMKRRVAQLLVECRRNPYAGELMGAGRHPGLADCRRVRFDVPTRRGKPRFRLIYRNEPTDGAPGRDHSLRGCGCDGIGQLRVDKRTQRRPWHRRVPRESRRGRVPASDSAGIVYAVTRSDAGAMRVPPLGRVRAGDSRQLAPDAPC